MYQVIIVIHVLLGMGIIGLILMQQGKGADAGAAFGTGSAGSVFGAQGAASFLSRTTAILATLFFLTSLGLAVINGNRGPAPDIMSSPETQQNSSALPELGGAKSADSAPLIPDVKTEEMPSVPAKPDNGAKIESTVVPQAEKIKTVDEQVNPATNSTKDKK